MRFRWVIYISATLICAVFLASVRYLMDETVSGARVIVVYTQNEVYPDELFKLSSVPLAIASYLKFGKKVFSVAPATLSNIVNAFDQGEFVVIGTHGSFGTVTADDQGFVGPSKHINGKMKLIYFGSCYFGKKRKLWEDEFPNAKVIGYDELTTPFTGWIYLFFQSWIALAKL